VSVKLIDEFDVDTIANKWLDFISKENKFKLIDNNHINVDTPITDPFGDSISLMIHRDGDSYTVTDQGYTIWNLEVRNISVKNKKTRRNQILHSIVKFENVKLSKNNEIFQVGNVKSIPQMINDVTQAVLKVSNLAFSNVTNTKKMFIDDVHEYFDSNKSFNYLAGLKMGGKSNLTYEIDFLFNHKDGKNDIAQVEDSLSKGIVEKTIGIFFDTEDFRMKNKSASYSLIVPSLKTDNDFNLANSLNSHNIQVVEFSNKDKIKKRYEFAA
jgi:hypothetical protein